MPNPADPPAPNSSTCDADECVIIVTRTTAISGEVDVVGIHVHPTTERPVELILVAAAELGNQLERRIAEADPTT